MWVADLIPWVSGWTIAFIAGIYEQLLTSIHHIDKIFLKNILGWEISWAWKYIQWNFLLTLIGWILTAILVWAPIIKKILDSNPIEIYSLFSWLIIASILWFLFKYWSVRKFWYFIAWLLFWLLITSILQFTLPTSLWWYFIWWMLWSSAMILPWISGSYILQIVWIYEPVIDLISWFTKWNISTLLPLVSLWIWVVVWFITLWSILKKVYETYKVQLIVSMTWLMAWALPSILSKVDIIDASTQTIFNTIGLGILWIIIFVWLSLLWKNTSDHEGV